MYAMTKIKAMEACKRPPTDYTLDDEQQQKKEAEQRSARNKKAQSNILSFSWGKIPADKWLRRNNLKLKYNCHFLIHWSNEMQSPSSARKMRCAPTVCRVDELKESVEWIDMTKMKLIVDKSKNRIDNRHFFSKILPARCSSRNMLSEWYRRHLLNIKMIFM